MNELSLNKRFVLYTVPVLVILLAALGYISYVEVRASAEKEAYRITERLVAEVEASRAYVRDILRPKTAEIVKPGLFIPEMMSASFVARGVFERFLKQYPDYHIKFASLNPRNPINQADKIEENIIRQFQSETQSNNQWQGIVSRNEQDYFTVAKPFYFKKGCLKCHGEPEDAPTSLIAKYGSTNGFGVKIGDVTMYSVGVPVTVSYNDIWRRFFPKFWPAMLLLIFFFLFVSVIFKQQVGDPVKKLIQSVKSFGEGDYSSRVVIEKLGPLEDLAVSYNDMAQRLSENIIKREKVEQDLLEHKNTLEEQVESRTHELSLLNKQLESKVVELETADAQIKSNLQEKESLLQEIHHRVKNNLNVISSLLRLQALSAKDQIVKEALKESEGRIYTMATVHESLYRSKSLAEIDLIPYLEKLINSLVQTYTINTKEISFEVNGDRTSLAVEVASPLGLVTNELVSNSLKYAFPGDQTGEIKVTVKRINDELELTFSDNGIGIASDVDWENSNTLGLLLVRDLVEKQLDGSIDLDTANGTKFAIKLKLNSYYK